MLLPQDALKFVLNAAVDIVLNAAVDTLPHNANLHLWHKKDYDTGADPGGRGESRGSGPPPFCRHVIERHCIGFGSLQHDQRNQEEN